MLECLGLAEDVTYRFSQWDPKNPGNKYEGTAEQWELSLIHICSLQISGSPMSSRSKVVILSRPKSGELRPHHKNHRKSFPSWRSGEPGSA